SALEEPACGDQHSGLARREVDRRQAIGAVESEAAPASALADHRERRLAEAVEITVDRANGDVEAARQLVGRDAGAARAQRLRYGKQSFRPPHRSNMTYS